MVRTWRRGHWIIAGLTSLVGITVLAAYTGIVGNRSDAMAVWLGENGDKILEQAGWISYALLALGLLAVGGGGGWYARTRLYQVEFSVLKHLAELDESLLRNLPGLVWKSGRDVKAKRVLDEFLRDCTKLFGSNVCRGWILGAEGDWLVPRASFGIPPETLDRSAFFIGVNADPTQLRGSAAAAYLARELRVIHLREENGKWQADDEDYVYFDKNRPHPPYEATVCVPITWERDERFGVLCVDGKSVDTFDSPETQRLLRALGTRIAAALKLEQELVKS